MPDGMNGGDKLAAKLNGIVARVGGGRSVRVGFLEGSTETDGTSLPMVAAIQEYGAPRAGIPPRPFFRTMVNQHKSEWGGELGKVLKATDYDGDRSLNLMGERISGELRQSIADLSDPPLSPVTLMLRKMRIGKTGERTTFAMVLEARRRVAAGESPGGVSEKPLVDSGTLFQRVAHELERESS